MTDLVPVCRALLSVSDKTGLVEFATALVNEFKVELISTGGTAKALRDAGLEVQDVSDVTGFPEMMDGRVKTLHPAIHGGLLALRDDEAHVAAMKTHGITPIDLVVVNLYPFAATIAKPGTSFDHAIENIDIGGPSMIRSASKNHRSVLVVTEPDRYEKVLGDLRKHSGSSCATHRLKQAQRAFAHTAEYDAMIASYLAMHAAEDAKSPVAYTDSKLPAALCGTYTLKQELRYGENPHQAAGLYVNPSHPGREASVAQAIQHHGKELSYINLLDADAALSAVKEFSQPAACITKHASPCGVGAADDLATAFERAYASDPLAAFGGIVAVNRPIDLKTAERIVDGQKFLEVIVAPGYADDALALLKDRWKNVRLLQRGTGLRHVNEEEHVPEARATKALSLRSIDGGFLVQEYDTVGVVDAEWKVVSGRHPSESELSDLKFAWLACKHIKSNAIVLAKSAATVGIGGGQVDRVGAARIAIGKAGDRSKGSVVASDAFFPFPDGPELLLNAGVTAIVQPGGSQRDQLTIDAVNAAGAAMIFTGRRHFRH